MYKFKLLVRYTEFITSWKQLGKTVGRYTSYLYTSREFVTLGQKSSTTFTVIMA
jgi:hypothetical protein